MRWIHTFFALNECSKFQEWDFFSMFSFNSAEDETLIERCDERCFYLNKKEKIDHVLDSLDSS